MQSLQTLDTELVGGEKIRPESFFSIELKENELNALIVGGGLEALRILNSLLSLTSEMRISLVAENFVPEIIWLSENNIEIELIEGEFRRENLLNQNLVFSAQKNESLADRIRDYATEAKVLFYVSDRPEMSDFRLKSDSFNELNTLEEKASMSVSKPWYHFSFLRLFGYVFGVLGVMLAGHLLFTLIPLSEIASETISLIAQLDAAFLYFMLGGFIAQMIDGALGMAYGVSATTFLLSLGIPPAVASMSVHTSEIFTSGVSGFMHLRFGNVNNKLFKTLLIPGVLGAILGAYVLTEFEAYNNYIKPIVGIYTLILGILIIWKVVRKNTSRRKVKNVGWLATLGGFLDAIGGGGWGPVVSSTLIARGKNPRIVVGSVNLAEFFVSVASSFTFFTLIGAAHWQIFTGLILGGVCAAPIAAYLSQKLNVKAMMLMVGIVVIIVSLRIIVMTFV